MSKNKKNRNDMSIIAIILISVLLLFLYQYFAAKPGSYISVSYDGEKIAEYSLSTEQEVPVKVKEGENIIVIKDGKAYVKKADCPDQICVNQKSISKEGESIICLPHKLIITVERGSENSLDGMSY